ncbi:MAG: sigma-70 family RNA polymerase sigma factor [Clostridia bacterium]|nr:sigma-70 family RNA polymerase sigma factor [Clostridia bacterium]
MTDLQIIESFWARSETAIAEVQNRYGAAGEAVAKNLLQNSADAEECVNDALLRLWNSIPPQRPNSLWAYFVKVIRNLALDRLRKQSAAKRTGLTLVLEELEEVIGTNEDWQEGQVLAIIENFLRSEEAENRTLFLRRYWRGESVADAAKAVGLSTASAKMRLSRMRGRLRETLKEEGINV